MLDHIITLIMLVMLQAVLGFDNLLYISLESKKAPKERQSFVRKMGIGLAIVFRIILLFVLVKLISYFQDPVLHIPFTDVIEGHFNIHSIIVLIGGIFILYTSVKEIWHMITFEYTETTTQKVSTNKAIFMIVFMNLVFSFDSILSAMALTENNWIIAIAIITGGILMIVASNKVAEFLQKNRMYEVLGLFILFLVGIMLISDGGHQAHLKIFGHAITAMNKITFYFILVILILVDVVQTAYQKNILKGKS